MKILFLITLLSSFPLMSQSTDGEHIDDTLQGDPQYERPEDAKRMERQKQEEQQEEIERQNDLLRPEDDSIERQEELELEKRENFFTF